MQDLAYRLDSVRPISICTYGYCMVIRPIASIAAHRSSPMVVCGTVDDAAPAKVIASTS